MACYFRGRRGCLNNCSILLSLSFQPLQSRRHDLHCVKLFTTYTDAISVTSAE